MSKLVDLVRCFAFLGLFVSIVSGAAADGRIVRPDPAFFSQLSGFEAEWCGEKLCFGSVLFRNVARVRATLVKGKPSAIYVEDDFRGIELLKPAFGLIGPVNASAGRNVETGRAVVTFDARGEVDSLQMRTPSLGTLGEVRR